MRRGLAFDGGVDREDDFIDALAHALEQRRDVEAFRRHAVERAERAAQHMVFAAEHAGAFQRPEIGDVLHDAEDMRVAAGSRQSEQGLVVSRLPQMSQTRIAAAASRIAAPSGSSSASRFLSSASAARLAERGPSPGSFARSWIRRSISGPAE